MENIKYAVCFLDILGYQELVEGNSSKKEIYRVKNCFQNALVEMENMKNEDDMFFSDIYRTIKIRVFSDTIIMVMQIPKDTKEIQFYCLGFLFLIRIFYQKFVADLRYFIRGGISLGQYEEKKLSDESVFVFSKAWIDAYKLERKAKYIRVLMGDEFFRFMIDNTDRKMRRIFLENLVYIDPFGVRCLDLYGYLTNNENVKKRINAIKKGVEYQIERHRTDPDIIEKYLYFVDYHNRKVHEHFDDNNARLLTVPLQGKLKNLSKKKTIHYPILDKS